MLYRLDAYQTLMFLAKHRTHHDAGQSESKIYHQQSRILVKAV